MRAATVMFTLDSSKLTAIKTAFRHNGTLYCADCWVEDNDSVEDIKPLLTKKLIKALYDVDCLRRDKHGQPYELPNTYFDKFGK